MNLRKLSVTLVVIAMVSIGFGNIISDNVQGAFIELIPSPNFSGFYPEDVAWNEAGTQAVVVGTNLSGGPIAYTYSPVGGYAPITSGYEPGQELYGVDYYNEPVYDKPDVLLVDADWDEEGVVNFYSNVLSNCWADVTIWDVWDAGMINQGKPRAVDMAPYVLVIWFGSSYLGGSGGGGDGLNFADEAEIAIYLDGGGNFFFSNLAFTYNTAFGTGTGTFTFDYLGIRTVNDMSSYEDAVNETVGDEVFSGLGSCALNWMGYGWLGQDGETDQIYPGLGTICIFGENTGIYGGTGIRYQSPDFKTMYFGYPLETMDPNDATRLMEMALNWYFAPEEDTVNVLVVDADYNENGLFFYYDNAMFNLNVSITHWDVWNSFSEYLGKPTSSVMSQFDVVIWIPDTQMDGEMGGGDAFDSTDESEIAAYLDGGGNFFLSNIFWTDYTSGGSFGPYGLGEFAYDYMGIEAFSSCWSDNEWSINGTTGDAVFGDIGRIYQNWMSYGWFGLPMQSDEPYPRLGATNCFWNAEGDPIMDWAHAGIRFDAGGLYKSVFCGFPLETLDMGGAAAIMRSTLDWFVPNSQPSGLPPASVLVVDADFYDSGLADYYKWSLENNSAIVTVWDVYGGSGKPQETDMQPYTLVVWVPTYDMEGDMGSGSAFDSIDETEGSFKRGVIFP